MHHIQCHEQRHLLIEISKTCRSKTFTDSIPTPTGRMMQVTSSTSARSFYRRTATCKAPRKRTFLVQVSARSARSVSAEAVVGGGPGGKGPRNPVICCWDNSDNSGDGIPSMTKQGLLACIAAAAATAVAMPHPATAADVESSNAVANENIDDSKFCEAVLSSTFLSEGEKEVMAPKQYRVREWVYVGTH